MIVLVTGLPRSGTSVTAGILHTLGVNMGDRLMPASPDNPKGFFEDLDFVEMHNAILGSREREPERRFLPHRSKTSTWWPYQEMIRRKCQQPVWGLKDPKLPFFLPEFLEALDTATHKRLVVVNVLRPFDEVVNSYSKLWGGMPHGEAVRRIGHYLFEHSRLEKKLTSKPTVDVVYSELRRNPQKVVEELKDLLRGADQGLQRVRSGMSADERERTEKAVALVDGSLSQSST